jgi:zinc transport system permease protein
MIELWYRFVEAALPFGWAQYAFMKNALLAVLFISPLFALLGTIVISNRMAFFSDVLGHSALTGIAIGMLLGFADPFWPMVIFAALLAVFINLFKGMTHAASDTVLGVFFSAAIALGVVILSKGGGFARFTSYLIGDILAVTPIQILWVMAIFLLVLAYWIIFGNALIMISINPVLARSRGIKVFFIETSFAVLLAVVVTVSIRLVGILIVNSLLILPAASARIISGNVRSYTAWAVLFSLVSGICGLLSSYFWGTACGATIVLFGVVFYALAALFGRSLFRKKSVAF